MVIAQTGDLAEYKGKSKALRDRRCEVLSTSINDYFMRAAFRLDDGRLVVRVILRTNLIKVASGVIAGSMAASAPELQATQ